MKLCQDVCCQNRSSSFYLFQTRIKTMNKLNKNKKKKCFLKTFKTSLRPFWVKFKNEFYFYGRNMDIMDCLFIGLKGFFKIYFKYYIKYIYILCTCFLLLCMFFDKIEISFFLYLNLHHVSETFNRSALVT